ncbi:MAG TPA: acyl-ACP thioesterase domain-containing protein [Ignavibacteriaceae bacterium]|nr:acyl-ACP thioesterase domain-containing protein [Ignavibacteriaceae bacterium]
MDNLIYKEVVKVKASDADFNNRLRLTTFFNFMQDAASVHADKLNVGFADLYKNNLFWVLSWLKLEIYSYPSFDETIHIETWPKGRNRLYALRDFSFSSENGNVICKAASAWLMLNAETKRIADAETHLSNIPFLEGKYALNTLPGKIISNCEKKPVFKKIMNYSDVDLNKHVNNAKYIELAMDSYSEEHYKSFVLKDVEVSFQSELKLGDEIEIRKCSDKLQDIIEGVNTANGKTVFISKMNWEKIISE